MESRGGETGGPTMDEFVDLFHRQGFRGEFTVLDSGAVMCLTCGSDANADRFTVVSIRRVEGVSDPADMMAIGALECPFCGARGTATFCYGARCPPGHAEALRRLRDERASTIQTMVAESADHSLVSDTGWLSRRDHGDDHA